MARKPEGSTTIGGKWLGFAFAAALALLPVSFCRRAAFISREPGFTSLESIRPIDLNKAGEAQLTLIPGIGPRIASAIVQYRMHAGPFLHVQDIRKVRGVGPGKTSAMAGWILMDDQGNLPVPVGSGIR
jgi:competence ComEA-like helix-hairpin-helix protein